MKPNPAKKTHTRQATAAVLALALGAALGLVVCPGCTAGPYGWRGRR